MPAVYVPTDLYNELVRLVPDREPKDVVKELLERELKNLKEGRS